MSEAVDCPTVVNEGCDHPIATHFHGTLMCYNEDKCRCAECRAANSRYKKHHRPKWEGEFPRMEHPLVDAAPVVAHVRELMEQGMGYRDVADAAGVSPSSIQNLLYGNRGKRRRPISRIRRKTAEKILATYPPPAGDLACGICGEGISTHSLVKACYRIAQSA